MSDVDFLEQFAKKYAWSRAPAKRRFRFRKRINHRMEEVHRLALTLGGVIDRALDDDGGLQSSDYSTYQIFDEDDLVFKLIDLENIKTSRVGYVPRRGIMSPAYIRLQPTSLRTISKYYYWFFYGAYLNNIFNGMGGGVRQNLTPTDLLEFPVPLPDIDTQQAIADFLDRETARIDLLIKKKQRLVELVASRIHALVDEAISDPKVPRVRFENVVRRIQRPVILSEHGELVRLGLLNRGRGMFKKPAADEEGMGDSSFCFVRNGDLILSGQFAWEGAVALATEDEEGCVVSHRYPVYRGKEGVNTAYLLGLLRSGFGDFLLNETSRGSAGRNRPLNTWMLGKEKIPVPSGRLQLAVDRALAFERKLKKCSEQSIELLRETRSATITAAVTGQIDVATWRKQGCTERHLDQVGEEISA